MRPARQATPPSARIGLTYFDLKSDCAAERVLARAGTLLRWPGRWPGQAAKALILTRLWAGPAGFALARDDGVADAKSVQVIFDGLLAMAAVSGNGSRFSPGPWPVRKPGSSP
jgi:hypothetical protein